MKYTKDYLEKLDKKIEMIPLTMDSAFKSVMTKNTSVFKRFLIETLHIDIDPKTIKIYIPKDRIREKDIVSWRDVERAMNICNGIRDKSIISLMATSGLRGG